MGELATTRDPLGARILLVEDDLDYAQYLAHVLRIEGNHAVTHVGDAETALSLLHPTGWDLLITDVDLPTLSGLDILRQVRKSVPDLPVVIVTAHASLDNAVAALRSDANEFLPKPVRPEELLSVVADLVKRAAEKTERTRRRVLAIGAHPDDVEIGVGGVLLGHRGRGDHVAVLTLSHGARGGEADARATEAHRAAELLGAELHLADLTDTRIEEGHPTVGLIEDVVGIVRPHVVYTHSPNDLHQDHRNTSKATMVAGRTVDRILCYQSPSATVDFRPVRFIDVDDYLDGKLAAIDAYQTQTAIRPYLDPELTRATARYWGRLGSGRYCEAFEVVRERGPGGKAPAVVLPESAVLPDSTERADADEDADQDTYRHTAGQSAVR